MKDKRMLKIEAVKRENVEIEIDEIDAFKILCETLDMDFILDDNIDIYPAKDTNSGEIVVVKDGKVIDDRGELFYYLCKVMSCIVPNCEVRNKNIVEMEKAND